MTAGVATFRFYVSRKDALLLDTAISLVKRTY